MTLPKIGTIDRYIFFQTLMGVAVAAGGVCLAIIMVDVVEQLRNIQGVPGTSTMTALRFTLMRTPGILELALPFAVLVGSIVTFMNLARSSEIVAMKASGISTWRFLSPVAALAALVGIFAVIVLGPSAARLNLAYETQLAEITSVAQSTSADGAKTTLWMRDVGPQRYYTISATRRVGDRFEGVTFLNFDATDGAMIERLDASSAVRTKSAWVLNNVVVNRIGLVPSLETTRTLPITEVRAEDTNKGSELTARAMPIWELPGAARRAAAAGGSPQRYWLQFHRKLALPLALLSMAMIAAVLSLSSERFGKRALMAASAISAGLLVYFVNDISGALATAGYAPTWMAAWCPPLAALFIALATVSYREDG